MRICVVSKLFIILMSFYHIFIISISDSVIMVSQDLHPVKSCKMSPAKLYGVILFTISTISITLLHVLGPGNGQWKYFKVIKDVENYYLKNRTSISPNSPPGIEDLNLFLLSEEETNTWNLSLPNNTKATNEEFTIIIITHNRREIMLRLLKHLTGLPRLNQLLLIWNENEIPSEEINWPSVSYKLRVLYNGKNSLHNRFLPLSIIETQAVFSLDDDSFVDHKSVIKAFEIWQKYRDRIVGFSSRGVKWIPTSNKWIYDPQPRNNTSLVLTGGAFIHAKYLGLYTYKMPPGMREHIDRVMNCEDLAMNFLVSNLTHKSPIPIHHEKNLRCQGCPDTGLWTQQTHFEERNNCINMFTKMFGYLPLFIHDVNLNYTN